MIKMLNQDCMDLMRDTPDKFYELAIVDPPYAVGASDGNFGGRSDNSGGRGSKVGGKMFAKHYANADIPPDEVYFKELFRVSKNQIIWGANYYPQFLKHSGWIFWDKLTTGPLSDGELAYQSLTKLVEKFTCHWSGFVKSDPGQSITERIHPNQKPVALYKWLLSRYAKPGDKILDTHGGSGSIAIACHDLGFDLTWTELDTDYYAAAVKRYQTHASQGSLFAPEPVKLVTNGELF